MKVNKSFHIFNRYEFILIFISIVLLVQFYSESLNALHKPLMVIIIVISISTIVTSCAFLLRTMRFSLSLLRNSLPFLVGLLLRLQPNGLVQGGQDQGLYVLNAINFARRGSMFIADPLAGDAVELRALSQLSDPISSMTKLTDGGYQIEFYPLHSLYLAIGEFIWQGPGRHLVMMFAFVISLIMWRKLASSLYMSKRSIEIFSWLYSVSPGLIFLAKFPVSEATAGLFIPILLLSILEYLRSATLFNYRLIPIIIYSGLLSFSRLSALSLIPGIILIAVSGFLGVGSLSEKCSRFVKAGLALIGVSIGLLVAGVIYATKQPGLYLPMRDYLVSVLEVGTVGRLGAFILLFAGLFVVLIVVKVSNKFPLSLSWEVLVSIGITALIGKQMLELKNGTTLQPWGYVFRNDGFLNLRFHFLYFLGLLTGPLVIFLVPISRRYRGIFFLPPSLRLILLGILVATMTRPHVPYLYYYGRYFLIDMLPLVLLALGVAVAEVYYSSGLGEKFSVFVLGAAALYFAFFSALPVLRNEQESPDFYDAVSTQVAGDLVLVDGMHQKIVPTLIVKEELRLVSFSPSSGQDFFELVRSLGSGAVGFESLWVMTPGRDGDELIFTDSFLSNTGHFREDGLWYSETPYSLLLPTRYVSRQTGWLLSQPPRCVDVPHLAATGRLRGFAHNLVKVEMGFTSDGEGGGDVICYAGLDEDVSEMLSSEEFNGIVGYEVLSCNLCEGSDRWILLSTL